MLQDMQTTIIFKEFEEAISKAKQILRLAAF